MANTRSLTVLCLASYEKGGEFMRECKRQGCRVILLTSQSIGGTKWWPQEVVDEVFLVPDKDKQWNEAEVVKAVSYLARTETIDRIVPLDDFDFEIAAALREHLRIPGMGDTTTRYFRDKLAMRMKAREEGVLVPDFVHVLNYERLNEFMARVPAPWLIKPRFEGSATGIKKIASPDELWAAIAMLGDRQSNYLLERFVSGDIYHIDTIISEGEVVFAAAHKYGHPPMDVAHGGGVLTTRTMVRGTEEEVELQRLNSRVLRAKGLLRGVSHTEFIKGHVDGQFYFLETSARVGGANIVELIEAATGINMWIEWARIEIARGERPYHLPPQRNDYGGLIVSLARQEWPDTSAYIDPEIVWRMNKRYHAGMIIRSPDPERVERLLDEYSERFYRDFFATAPLPERPVS